MTSDALPTGEAVGQYRILSLIGEGGMGRVYLAEDGKLARKVALKILPPEYTRDRSRLARFEQEARAASALNHPAILTIHDVGRSADVFYIATEFIEGDTLRARLHRGGMKIREVLDIATQIASALVASHSAGIVHRDLKPENIMIRPDGFVKVLDFGLAKLMQQDEVDATVETATVPRMPTDAGTVLGTSHYMSPEQAKGRSVDARSDIFSLGTVLYEMITGRVPFEGETRSHVVVSILEKDPLPLTRYLDAVPAELQRIVSKMLAKNPEERYQVIKDVQIDLKSLRHELEIESASFNQQLTPTPSTAQPSGSGTAPEVSNSSRASSAEYLISGIRNHKKATAAAIIAILAVIAGALLIPGMVGEASGGTRLPVAVADFDNLTGEKELDGLSGMLITSLEQSRRLAVMTRTRMFDVLRQHGHADAVRIDETLGREIARAENVQALVTASVQKFGELYILDLKVLDPAKNEYIFAAKEEGKGKENIPAMIDRLSEKMRLGLKEKQVEVEGRKTAIASVTTTNLEAYQHYFVAEQLIAQLDIKGAIDELRKAVALDPGFVLAQLRLAYALNWNASSEARVWIARAMQHLDQAPPKEQLYIRAESASISGDVDAAVALYQHIAREYPSEKEAIFDAADLLHHRGDFASAEEGFKRVLRLDPLFERAHQHLTWNFKEQARFREMVGAATEWVAKASSPEAYLNLADAYDFSGDREGAARSVTEGRSRYPASAELLGWDIVVRGEPAVADLKKLRDAASNGRQWNDYSAVLYYHYLDLGQFEAAIRTTDESIARCRTDCTELLANLHIAKALPLARLGRADEARKEAQEALRDDSHITSGSRRMLAGVSYWLGDPVGLRNAMLRVSHGNPMHAMVADGFDAKIRGDLKGAAMKWEQALVRAPNYQALRHWVAALYLEMGEYDKAYAAIQPNLYAYPPPMTLDLAAQILAHKGDVKGAREQEAMLKQYWSNADRNFAQATRAKERWQKLKI